MILSVPTFAGEHQTPPFTIKGRVYFDYIRAVSTDGPRTDGQSNEFRFRRAYFTFEKELNEIFKIRFRTNVDNPKGLTKVSFDSASQSVSAAKTDSKLRPFVKHLYLQWKNLLPESKLYIGMAATPTKEISEFYWGYRSIAKSMIDNFKDMTGKDIDATSADLGVALMGNFSDNVGYHFMFANGSHYSKPENDHLKKGLLSIYLKPAADFIIEAYGDYEPQNKNQTFSTYKILSAYQKDAFTAGVEYMIRSEEKANTSGGDLTRKGLSIFARYKKTDIGFFARFDRYDPDSDIDDDETNLVILGLDYTPHKNVNLMPNIWYYMNGDQVGQDADIFAVLTFQYKF
jgi:hypothetical protein